MLQGVRIQNFDVFDDDVCGVMIDNLNPNKNRLMNLNALIGRNRTGKSSFISALSFVKRCVTSNVSSASTVDGRPGFSRLVEDINRPAIISLYFKLKGVEEGKSMYAQYDLWLSATTFGSPFVEQEKVTISRKTSDGQFEDIVIMQIDNGRGFIISSLSDTLDKTSVEVSDDQTCALGLFGKIASNTVICLIYKEISSWFFCQFSSEPGDKYFADGNAPGAHKHLNGTGSNVGNVIEYMKKSNPKLFESITNKIAECLPGKKRKKNLPSHLEESPDKLLLYLLMLYDSDPRSTIFIETPDKDLYHDMVDLLTDEMRDFTLRNPYSQIIFSTHNPYIVESLSPREIWVFKRSYETEYGDLTITSAASDPIVEAMFKQGVGMGAIWYSGHLDEYDGDDTIS